MRFARQIQFPVYTFLAGLFGLLLHGCTLRNEVDPGLLGIDSSKIVVSGYLSPQDTMLAIRVTRTQTVVGDSLNLLETGIIVPNAKVTLSEGDRSIVLPFYKVNPPADSAYSIDARLLPIVAGHTYKLTVETPAGQRLSSTCTIPQAVLPKSILFDSLTQTQSRATIQRHYVRTRWQDPAGQTNYYQVAGIFRYSSITNFRDEKYSSLSFDDDNRGLFSDAGVDGTIMVSGRAYLTSVASATNVSTSFSNQYSTASVTVNLMSVEPTYYRFQEAIIRQRRARNNPFAEPVLIPSNIQGGLGCFAGYNNATLTMTLK